MEVTSFKQLLITLKNRVYSFLATTAFNLSTFESALMAIATYLYPSHAKEILEVAITYFGFKKTP